MTPSPLWATNLHAPSVVWHDGSMMEGHFKDARSSDTSVTRNQFAGSLLPPGIAQPGGCTRPFTVGWIVFDLGQGCSFSCGTRTHHLASTSSNYVETASIPCRGRGVAKKRLLWIAFKRG
ncbi:hypothetical protein N7539_004407 [Penicillium diatomitis]|uniref:Uncharacterized protein n=1 Tax=Penicillium diatomitis TaxID=2819901 RepID=A0A9W9XF02_9EURO|nr:uncharacterized protein N7539_004407 [Penicillium diatomitis]KAJ5489517.1 hypothetical protein N7539_004407 [Penicillium diatomitis]